MQRGVADLQAVVELEVHQRRQARAQRADAAVRHLRTKQVNVHTEGLQLGQRSTNFKAWQWGATHQQGRPCPARGCPCLPPAAAQLGAYELLQGAGSGPSHSHPHRPADCR